MGISRSSTARRPTVLLVAGLFSGNAAAEGPPNPASPATEAIAVELIAPSDCGNTAAFLDAVRARTARIRPSEGDPRERRFTIEVTQSAGGFDGTLRVVDPAGQGSERTLSADSCRELIEALAIITALAIDPDSANASGSPANGEVPGEAAAPPPAASAAPRDESRPLPPAAAEPAPPSLSWFLGAGVGVDLLYPGAVSFPTGSLTLEGGVERRSVLSPSVRASLRRSLDATLTSESGSANLALTTLRVEVCPLRAQWTQALRVLPCAVVDGGVLQAEGRDVQGAQSHARPWLAAGLGGRLSIGRTSPRLDLELGAVIPIIRDTFRFTPDEFVYSATGPAVFAAAGISFAL